MSLWQALVDGFTEGVVAASAYQQYRTPQRGCVEELCRQCGWAVDERDKGAIYLHFDDRGSSTGIRRVRITEDGMVIFSACSEAALREHNVPGEVLAYLLFRNISGTGLGMWGMQEQHGRITFHIMHQALADGLDAEFFRYACQALASEAADFDQKLRQARLLR